MLRHLLWHLWFSLVVHYVVLAKKNAPFPNFHFLAILPSNKGRSIERTLKKLFFCVLWPPNLSNWPQYWKGTTTQNFFPTLSNLPNFNEPMGTSQQAGHTFGPQISWFLGANSLFLTSNLLGQKKKWIGPQKSADFWSKCVVSLFTGPQWVIEVL